jgi:hypothetical protein
MPHPLTRRILLLSAAACSISPTRASAMNHVVLLGDSVFDNGAYVGAGPDVIRQLRSALPASWRATLNARDGSVTADIEAQLTKLPGDASHLILSIGGNDALGEAGVLDENARSVGLALDKLAAVRERFQRTYRTMLSQVVEKKLPTAVCTIYEARFPDADLRRRAETALTLLNDCSSREAFARELTLIDLRLICDSDADFANPIEPSVEGGAKIARAIAKFATGTGTRASVIPR